MTLRLGKDGYILFEVAWLCYYKHFSTLIFHRFALLEPFYTSLSVVQSILERDIIIEREEFVYLLYLFGFSSKQKDLIFTSALVILKWIDFWKFLRTLTIWHLTYWKVQNKINLTIHPNYSVKAILKEEL